MAKTMVCDGCKAVQEPGAKGWGTVGVVVTPDYCPDCLAVANTYIAQRDKLHDDVQKTYRDGMKELNKEYKGKLNVFPA